MNNNDILRSIRYTFDFNDATMIEIFGLADMAVSRANVSDWLKKEDLPEFQPVNDFKLASFLDGLINYKRGKKDGENRLPEKSLNNNIILRKLKIAFDLKDDDVLEILSKAGKHISKHELSAFFRKPEQSQYRPCLDQMLRNFLHGLQLKHRPKESQIIP